MIKNIILDIGNVLVRFMPDESMRRLGIPEEKIPALLNATVYSPLWVELDRGIIPETDVINMMKENTPELAKDIQTFYDEGKEYLVESFDYSFDWINSFKRKGYKVYLLSNYPVSYFENHIKNNRFSFLNTNDDTINSSINNISVTTSNDMTDSSINDIISTDTNDTTSTPINSIIDGKIVSGYVKMVKPDHDIYELLLSTYKLNADECVFLDDRMENVEAAREVGMHALRFTDIEETDRRLTPLLQKP